MKTALYLLLILFILFYVLPGLRCLFKRLGCLLRLTEKGAEMGRIIAGKIGTVLEGIGSELSDEERRAFYHSLSVISESLERVAQRGGKREF